MNVGKDITKKELEKEYDAIVFAMKGESFRGKRLETVSLRMTASAAIPHAESRNEV